MLKNSIFTLLFLIASQFVFSQTYTLSGSVYLADSNLELTGVAVYVEKTGIGTVTNAKGEYQLKNLPEGKILLIASALGFNSKKFSLDLKSNTSHNFYLTESINNLPQVSVISGGSIRSKELPGSVTYLSPKELAKFSYTNANQLFSSIAGVNIQSEDGFGLRPNIGMRGTGTERSSKITLMEDGILIAPAPYSAPSAYYFPTIGRMQGVEVLKGSSQIKYGPYTTGGAINLISTQIPESFRTNLNIFGSRFSGRNIHANVGDSYKHTAFLLETFQYGSDGFKQLDNGGNTGFQKQDYLAKIQVFNSMENETRQNLLFKIGESKEHSNETYLGLTKSDFRSTPFRRYAASQKDEMNNSHSQYSLTYQIYKKAKFNISVVAYNNKFKRNWYKLDRLRDSIVGNVSIASLLSNPDDHLSAMQILKGGNDTQHELLDVKANNRSYSSKGIQASAEIIRETKRYEHRLEFGLRLHRDEMDRFQWVDQYKMKSSSMSLFKNGIAGTESNRIESTNALAAWVKYNYRIKDLHISPGIRLENIESNRLDYGNNDVVRSGVKLKERSNSVIAILPGFGVSYVLGKSNVLFAGVHKGFAPPGSKEGALPEESINYEIGMRYEKRYFDLEAVLFLNTYSNLLGSDLSASSGSGTGDLFNGGKARTRGLELSADYDILAARSSKYSLPFSMNYTFTRATFESSFDSEFGAWGNVEVGDFFPYLAVNKLNFSLQFAAQMLSIGLHATYSDGMRTSAGQEELKMVESTDAYTLLDISCEYKIKQYLSLFSSCTNLLDNTYIASGRPAGYRPGAPRMINVGVKLRLE